MLKRWIGAGAMALLLAACGSAPTRIALDSATKQKLTEVKVLSVLPQDEPIVRAEAFGASVALGGGLIGALIDSKVAEGRQNTLQDVIAPFYKAVDDYDFRTGFRRALETSLSGNTPLRFAPIEHTALIPMPNDITARTAALQAGRGQMTVRTGYTFTGDFSRLNVVTYVQMNMPGSEAPVFLNTFVYQSKPAGTGGADSVRAWSENKGAAYRATMDEATREILAMLKLDLAANAIDPSDAPKAKMMKIDGAVQRAIEGPVLAASVDRKIVRDTAGNVYSLPQ